MPKSQEPKKTKLKRPNSRIEDAWLGLGDLNGVEIVNPLLNRTQEDIENPGQLEVGLMVNPEYLSYAAKVLLGIDLLPEQAVILEELWKRPFPMYIASRGFGKSFLLAIYATLKCALVPGTKVVGTGAAYRQSRIIWEYMCTIWQNAPVLRSICDRNSGPKTQIDRVVVRINTSVATFIPLGDGTKVRGLRANTIIADEFASIPPEVYETVVGGFASVKQKPVDGVKEYAKRQAMKEMGTWDDRKEQQFESTKGNQNIISGTADYDFMHFADYWRKYWVYIKSQGDPKKLVRMPNGEMKSLTDYFEDGNVPESFDHKDYSIIRIPYEKIPKGFMDDKIVARAKATVHHSIYLKEYGACKYPGTMIVTDDGCKKIEDIKVGDMVLTHKGRFRPVTKSLYRNVDETTINIKTYGYNQYIGTTKEHPWFNGERFEPCSEVENGFLTNLQELNNEVLLNLEDYCSNFRYYKQKDSSEPGLGDKIYPCFGGAVPYSTSSKKPKKGLLNKCILMSRELGICLGYYAAEGSIGADGRQVEFSLDGHINDSLESYITQLCECIKKVFNIDAKVHKRKSDNTARVVINSRLVAELFSKICPGNCYSKYVIPKILYSNKALLQGFVIGYWNGDGHIRNKVSKSGSSSISLSAQIRTVLSYFGISSSFIERPECETVIKGKKYKTKKHFRIEITGKDQENFCRIFYGEKNKKSDSKGVVQSPALRGTVLKVRDRFEERYKGPVFNLEVQEDNSYTTLASCVHNCFPSDSDGFFKRTLIESCVARDNNVESPGWPIWCPQAFNPLLRGQPGKKYVIAIDPAAYRDNFAIVVLELWPEHTRIVYCWSTNLADFQARRKAGLVRENDYYGFCSRKIRDLAKVFPTDDVVIDAQGGGLSVVEALHDKDKLRDGEVPWWPTNKIINPDKELDTDVEAGRHIIHMFQFAKYEAVSEANNGTRKDLEDKVLLFPRFDTAQLEIAAIQDAELAKQLNVNKIFDTMEDAVMEIEALKDELCTIQVTRTGTGVQGRERFDTPETTTAEGKKTRMRKDRYSALIMGVYISRHIHRAPAAVEYNVIGGFAHDLAGKKTKGESKEMYSSGPDWFISAMNKGGSGLIQGNRRT